MSIHLHKEVKDTQIYEELLKNVGLKLTILSFSFQLFGIKIVRTQCDVLRLHFFRLTVTQKLKDIESTFT